MTDRSDVPTREAGLPDEVDPRVAELVVAIRDRFGLRGLRAARRHIDREITLAEDALRRLPAPE